MALVRDHEGLAAFIDELRARHAAGEFRGQADRRSVPGIILGDVAFAADSPPGL